MSNPESDLTNRILLALGPDPTVRLFRNLVACGWHGRVVEHTPSRMVILNPFPIHAGLFRGSADLIGIATVDAAALRPGPVGIFCSLEVKTPGSRTAPERKIEQDNWRDMVLARGGIAGYVESPEQAIALLAAAPKSTQGGAQ